MAMVVRGKPSGAKRRTDGIESSEDEVEDGNGITDLLTEFKNDSSKGTTGLNKLLVTPELILVEAFGNLRELVCEEKGTEGNGITWMTQIMQISLLFQQRQGQWCISKAKVEETRCCCHGHGR